MKLDVTTVTLEEMEKPREEHKQKQILYEMKDIFTVVFNISDSFSFVIDVNCGEFVQENCVVS